MPHGFGVPAAVAAGSKTFSVAAGRTFAVPDGVPLLGAHFQRIGDTLLIIAGADGTQLLLGDFFARGKLPDLVQSDGVRLSGRLVAHLAAADAAAGQWVAAVAGVDDEARIAGAADGDGGDGAPPADSPPPDVLAERPVGDATGVQAESATATADTEVSAGGDLEALPGDIIAVTRQVDAFDLRPSSFDYGESRFDGVALPSPTVPLPDHDDESFLLFNQTAGDGVSLPPPTEITRWDNGRRWEVIGTFGEVSGAEPEAPIEAGRLISARDGHMARLEADLTISTEQIALFLQVDAATLRTVEPSSQPASGTAMRMAESIQLTKGEQIHFEVFLDGASQLPFNDFAVMTVRFGGETRLVPISSIEALDTAERGGSGWLTLTYIAGTSGSYRFGFAVLNDDDQSPSRLYVDNVRRGGTADYELETVRSSGDDLGGRTEVQRPLPGFAEPVQRFTLAAGETLTVDALANVIDPDGYDAPRLAGVDRSGAIGTIDFDGDGFVTYQPGDFYRSLAQGETGTDRFAYVVDGGNGGIGRATVEVTLAEAGVNDAPTGIDDGAVVDLALLERTGLPQAIAVLLNDDDIDSDDDRATLRIVSATSASGAEVTVARIGEFAADGLLYDPRGLDAAQRLSLGETLASADTITYVIADRWGATAEARVAVTWIGANDAPTAGDDTLRIGEDATTAAVDVLANDDDIDGNDDASTLRLIAATAERGTAEVTADGRLLIGTGGGFDGLALGEETAYAVRYTIGDRHGGTGDGRVEVVVVGANDAPTAADDAAEASEDGPAVLLAALGNDDDIDSDDDPATLKVVSAHSARGAGIGIHADGTLLYEVAGVAAFDELAEGEVAQGFDAVTYTISDRHGATAQGRVDVTVTGRNDAIDARDDTFADDGFGRPLAVTEDRVDPLAVLANDVDPDRGDTRTFTHINGAAAAAGGPAITLPSGAAVSVLGTGELAFDPGGRFDWLSLGETATETFTYTVADGYGSSDRATVTLILRGINDAPVARDDVAETDEETLIRVGALANDFDPDRLDAITLTGTDLPSELFAAGADGAIVFDPRGRLDRLSVGQTETFVVRYEISDPHGAQAAASVTVTVRGVNDGPVAGDDEFLVFADEGVAATQGVSLLATDRDPDERDVLSVTAVNGNAAAVGHAIALPAGGLLTVFVDGTFAYDPQGAFAALARDELTTVAFTYTMGDGHGGTGEAQVTLIIRGVNDAPLARPDTAAAIENGELIFADVLANDFDPDGPADTAALRLISAVAASGADARISPDQTLAYGTLAAFDWLALGQMTTDDVVYTIRDAFGVEAQGHLTVTVTGSNDAPKAAQDTSSFNAAAVATIDVRVNDDDVDSDDDGASLNLVAAVTAWGDAVRITADGRLEIDAASIDAFRALGEGDARTFEDGILYTITDRHGAAATGAVDVTVVGVNDAIDARDDAFTIGEDDSARLVVDANDVDPDIGDGRRITAIDGIAVTAGSPLILASGASITLLADNRLEFTPGDALGRLGAGASAIETFAYTIADDHGSQDTATVTVTINGVNDLPIARDDGAATFEDEAIRIDVLANDTDPDDGDGLRVRTIIDDSQGANGEIFIDGDGRVVYDPAGRFDDLKPGESRSVEFRTIIEDGNGGEAAGRLTVTVSGRNHAPVAGDDAFVVRADEPAAPAADASVLLTDRDADGDPLTLTAVNGDAGAVGRPIELAGGGRLTVLADGTFAFEPMGAFDGLARDETRELTFDYTVSDGAGASDTATVTLTILGVNDAPEAGADVAAASEDGGAVRIDVLANDDDVDSDDDRSTLRLLGAAAERGEVTTTADRALLYTAGAAFDGLAEGETATDRIVYTLADRHGAETTGLVAVTVTGRNDGPTAVADTAAVIEDGAAVTIDVRANDDDIDSDDDAATLRIVAAVSSIGGVVRIAADGTLTFDPAGVAAFDGLAAGEVRTFADAITYTVEDRHGARATATVSLTVTGVNDGPVAGADMVTVAEDALRSAPLALLGNDGDALRVVGIDGRTLAPGEVAVLASGARVRIEAVGQLIYEPAGRWEGLAAGESATDRFTYRADDGAGGNTDGQVAVTIIGANDAPVAVADSAAMAADETARIAVRVNDDDIDSDDTSASLKLVAAASAIGGTVGIDADGMLPFDGSGVATFIELAAGETRTFSGALRYTIEDRHGARAEGAVDLVVTGVNDPIAAVDDAITVSADEAFALAVTGNDLDPDFGDPRLILAIDGAPVATGGTVALASGAVLTLLADGRILYDPNGAFAALGAGETAVERFAYVVGDGHGSSDEAAVTLTVAGRNDAPIAADDATVTDEDAAVRVYALANDSDPDARDTLAIRTVIAGSARIDGVAVGDIAEIGEVRVNADGTLTYDPAGRFDDLEPGGTRTVSFQYVAEDGQGATATATATIAVHGVADPQPRGQELLGSFEDTDPLIANSAFPGWTHLPTRATGSPAVTGLADFAGDLAAFRPTHLGHVAQLTADDTSAADITDLLGLPAGALPIDSDGTRATAGTAMTLALTLPASAQTLAFDWNFLSAEDGAASGINDIALFTVSDGATSRVFTLADARTLGIAASGWHTSIFDLSALFPNAGGGTLRIGFAVLDDQTPDNPSRLLLDNVRLDRVLSPDYALIGGSGGDGLTTWRQNPTALDDTPAGAAVSEDGRLDLAAADLLANDIASHGAAAGSRRITAVETASGLGLAFIAGNLVHFDAAGAHDDLAAGDERTEALIYTLTDANGGTDRASVTVRIVGVNDAPIAAADVASTSEDDAVQITVAALVANDRDPDVGDTLTFAGAEGSGLLGRLTLDGNVLTYDPAGRFESLGATATAVETITYTVRDRLGAEATGTLTLTIEGRNDAPVAGDDAIEVSADRPYLGARTGLSVLANDADPDSGDQLAVIAVAGTAAAVGQPLALAGGGVLTLFADGSFDFDPAGDFDHFGAGEVVSVSVPYTVADNNGGTMEATLTIRVVGVNDAPVAAADRGETSEDAPLVLDVLANDVDADDRDRLAISSIDADGVGGRVTVDADGTLTYDPRGAFDPLAAGSFAEETFFYTAHDLAGVETTASVTVRIAGRNDAIAAVDDEVRADEDAATILTVLGNDLDPDLGDGRRIVAVNGATAALGDRIALPSGAVLVLLADGTVSYDAAGAFESLGRGETALDHFSYVVADDAGTTSTATVAVSVEGRNDAPLATADQTVTDEDAGVRIAVLANDRDADASDSLTITGVDQARTFGVVRINADGTLTYDPNGEFDGLAEGETATDTFTYTSSDGNGGEATATVTVTIHGTGAPQLNPQQLVLPFETTDPALANALFPGWRQEPVRGTGATSVAQVGAFEGRLAPFTTTHLDKAALLTLSGGSVAGVNDLLHLPAGSLGGTHGTAIAATISLGSFDAGADGRITLSFDWNFLGGETGNPAALDDAAVFTISNGSGVDATSQWFTFTLADIAGTGSDASGWRTSVFDLSDAFTIPPDGVFLTLGFALTGSSNLDDPSQLLLDNVRLNRALPSDYALVGGSGDDGFATWLQNPTAIDDGAAGTVTEEGTLDIDAGGLLANDVASRGAAAGSRRIIAVETLSGLGLATLVDDDLRFEAAGAHDDLAAGDQRVETLIYTLTDANGGRDTGLAQVTITGVNDAPVAAAIDAATDEDGGVAIDIADLLALARDVDAGDRLTFAGAEGSGLLGLVSVDAFTVRYDPGDAFQTLAAGETATEIVRYFIEDRLGAGATGTITVTITGRNDAPAALADAFTVSEDGATPLAVLANDGDIDGDALRITRINGFAVPADGVYALPSGALLSVDPIRGLTYDAAGRYEWLAAGESRDERFTYTIDDGNGGSAEAEVTLTVVGANDDPTAGEDQAVTDEDAMVRIAVLADDTDADVSDRLSVLSVDTAGTLGEVRTSPDGSLIYDPDGRFDDLFAGQSVTDTFRYTIDDGHGGSSTAAVTVTIHGVGTPQSHPQQLLSSFEIPWQQAGPGWEAEPFAGADTSPIRLTQAFAADFGDGHAIRDDLKAEFARFTPTHLDQAVQLAAFGSSGRGAGIAPSAIETFLAVPGGALPDDAGAFSGESGDGTEANAGSAIRTRVALTAADGGGDGALTLSFDWNFFSAETVADNAAGNNDFAVFSVSDGSSWRLFTLADARTTGFGASGWRTSVFDLSAVFALPADGALDLVIGFAVLNDQTPDNPSYLIVDNVRFDREIGTDYALLGASGGDELLTWRQNPTAFDDAPAGAQTAEEAPITIVLAGLLANDAASRGATALEVTAVARVIDGVTGEPVGGHVQLLDTDGDGKADAVGYDPRGVFDALAEGEIAIDHFRYTVTDANGGSDEASVEVRVAGGNDAPLAFDDTIEGSEDGPITGSVLADNGGGADRDIDGDALRVDTVPLVGPQHGALTLNADGTFVYTPDQDFAGVDSFTYRVSDRPAGGLSDTGTVQLLVAPVNDAPIARDDAMRTNEDTTIAIGVLANDSDADAGDTLRPIAIAGIAVAAGQSVTLASGAVASLNADGTIGYDPRAAFASLRAGEQGTDSFTYTTADGHGGSAEARVTVTIDGRNDVPLPGADSFTTGAGTALVIAAAQLLANDIDLDAGDALTVTDVDASGAIGAVGFDGTNITYDPAGRFQALGVGETAIDIINYTVRDIAGSTAEGEIRVTVAGVNDAPQAANDAAETAENRSVVVDVLANDRDPDSNDRFSIIDFETAGTLGRVSLNADGTVTYDPSGGFDDLAAGEIATDRFRYVIADGSGARDTAEVTVTVTGKGSVERLVDSFEQPFDREDISRGSSDVVAIKTQHVETDGAKGTYAPTDGGHLAWLEAYGTTRANLDAFLGVDLRAAFIDADGSLPSSGAAFRLSVQLEAGDELSFDWLFDARDAVSGNPADNDFALISITGGSGITDFFKLSDVRETGDRGASGWLSTVYTADQTGTVTIAFAAVNDRASDTPSSGNPASENSMLLVDNLRINRDFADGYQVVEASADGKFETVVHQHG